MTWRTKGEYLRRKDSKRGHLRASKKVNEE